MNKNKLLKPLLLIAVIILFCSVLARLFSESETLLEYAEKNPEIAYRKEEPDEAAGNKIENDTDHQMGYADSDIVDQEPLDDHSSSSAVEADKENRADGEDVQEPEKEELLMNGNPERIVYQEGFYYEPLSDEMISRITGISYPVVEDEKDTLVIEAVNIAPSQEDIQISYEDLCYMSILHYNFHGVERTGELICNKAIAQDLIEIFYELYQNEYQIEQIRLIDEYGGDDTLSMQDNNTSCFNYRVVDGTSNLSKHALGLAIDINPFFNPYVVYRDDGSTYISPQGSEAYTDRGKDFAYKIDENDLCYRLFKEHGFIWGGNWNSCKDYQHFQKVPD